MVSHIELAETNQLARHVLALLLLNHEAAVQPKFALKLSASR
jgi:hypothetical protein